MTRPKGTPPEVEAAKRANVLQVLFKCARLVNERAIDRVNDDAGRRLLRPAVTNLLPHISFEGTPISEIAKRIGVTKQAVSKLVAELEAEGTVELVPHPDDGRAKLVRFTPAGAKAIMHGLGILGGIEEELAREVGAAKLRALHETLLAMVEILERT
ncbi:MAG: MarR family transcriptional regulator [Deltaproteobacteria bacterium]|nr:MarR family transcriptional regulator [Deltaproteobacteria bacterium]